MQAREEAEQRAAHALRSAERAQAELQQAQRALQAVKHESAAMEATNITLTRELNRLRMVAQQRPPAASPHGGAGRADAYLLSRRRSDYSGSGYE